MFAIPILLGLVLAAPADESALGAARLPATDRAILNFFHKRSQPPPSRAAIEELARALGSENATEADDAHGELVSIGAPVVPVLREVANRVDAVRGSPDGQRRSCNSDRGASSRPPARRGRPVAGQRRKVPGTAEAAAGLPALRGTQRRGLRGIRLGSHHCRLPGGPGRPGTPRLRRRVPRGFAARARARGPLRKAGGHLPGRSSDPC